MLIHDMESIPEIRAIQPMARDKFLLCDVADMPELINRHCGSYGRAAIDALLGRNTALTATAEKWMHRYESEVFSGLGYETRDSVVGAFPNIPAMLAGFPCAMRQRYRTTDNTGPLTLYLELTGSSGVHGESFIARGAAVLALARLLSNTRPVEIWTCTTYGTTNRLQMIAAKVETSPLDVARGAAMLCNESIRTCVHEINEKALGHYHSLPRAPGACLGWAYGRVDLERQWAGQILARILNPGSTMVYIPAAYAQDDLDDPVQWVRDMLAKYGQGSEDED
jgi:hypothetical protein